MAEGWDGERLKRLRIARGWTQAELGHAIGARTGLDTGRWERGEQPRLGAIYRLAEALGCSWDELLGPTPGHRDDRAWASGYRAGLAEAATAVRELLEHEAGDRG